MINGYAVLNRRLNRIFVAKDTGQSYIDAMDSERPKLNRTKIRNWLKAEDRKQSYLVRHLGVSGSLVTQMLCDGHVPQEDTLIRLSILMNCTVNDLLVRDEAKRTA